MAQHPSVYELFSRDIRFVVPRFQRPYVWNQEKQWEPLWEEIRDMAVEKIASKPRPSDYFLGAVITRPLLQVGLHVSDKEVIDGQQRLTTLQLLIKAVAYAAAEAGDDFIAGRARRLTTNEGFQDEQWFKVWPTDADRADFRHLMGVSSRKELDKRFPLPSGRRKDARPLLVQAFTFFVDSINEYLKSDQPPLAGESPSRRLVELLDVIQNRLRIVLIDLDENDDPLVIFESLNGRMTPLLASDLIKNFAIRAAGADGDRLYEQYWKPFDTDKGADGKLYWRGTRTKGRRDIARLDQFVSSFLQCQASSEVRRPDTFQAFKNWWSSRRETGSSDEGLFNQLKGYVEAFREMIDPAMAAADDETKFFSGLLMMDNSLVYPLLLFLLKECRDAQCIVEQDVPGILRDIESYLIRRHVCGLTKKKYNYVFPKIIAGLRDQLAAGCQSLGRAELRHVLLAFDGPAVEWPNDRAFQRAWMKVPLYEIKPSSYSTLMLARIDQALRRYDEPVSIDYAKMSIEHVLPQKWQEHYPLQNSTPDGDGGETPKDRRNRLLHSIGNLTLTGTALNSAMRHAGFAVKRKALAEQNSVRLNVYFQSAPDSWDEVAIAKRSQELLGYAEQLWPYPSAANQGRGVGGANRSDSSHSAACSPIDVPAGAPASHDSNSNPFRHGGNYWAIVEALRSLGVDRWHGLDFVVEEVRNAMGTDAWAAFVEKEKRNPTTGKDVVGRIIQNISVLTRPEEGYGGKLRKIGLEIRLKKRQGVAGLFKIHPDPVNP